MCQLSIPVTMSSTHKDKEVPGALYYTSLALSVSVSLCLSSIPCEAGQGGHGCRKLGAIIHSTFEVPKTRATLSKAPNKGMHTD